MKWKEIWSRFEEVGEWSRLKKGEMEQVEEGGDMEEVGRRWSRVKRKEMEQVFFLLCADLQGGSC